MEAKDNFKWDMEELTPLELLEKYKDKFPRIVKVTQGFCGTHSWESLSQAEILLINCCTGNLRALAKDPLGRYFSIPAKFDTKFYTMKHKKRATKKAKPLSELLQNHTLPFDVELESEDSCLLTAGTDESSRSLKLRFLTITDTYEERFLKANLIRPEGLHKQVIRIASYVKAKMIVSQSEELLEKILSATKFQVDLTVGDNDQQVLMYSKDDVEKQAQQAPEEENIYESIEPSKTLATQDVYETMSKASMSGFVKYDGHKSVPNEYVKGPKPYPFPERFHTGRRPSLPNLPSKPPPPMVPRKPSVKRRNSDEMKRPALRLSGGQGGPTGGPEDKWAEVPDDIGALTCDEMVECLALLHLEKHSQAFKDNQIDGALLKTLDVEDLKNDLQMNGLEAKKLIMFSKEGWRPYDTQRLPRN